YLVVAPNSLAIKLAILFSNPSNWRLENGMFSGSAHTRNSFFVCACNETQRHKDTKTQRNVLCLRVSVSLCFTNVLLKRKHRQHAALVTEAAHVRNRPDCSECGCRIFAADVTCDTDTGPSADTGQHGDVLLPVGGRIRHRIADDSRWRFELPQLLTG